MMKIHFRDVQTGKVEARAVIEIDSGVFLNEITLLNINGEIVVEFPRKSFIGKNDRPYYLDIITFENEDKKILWELQIKQAYAEWRKQNKKVLIYEEKSDTQTTEPEVRGRFRKRTVLAKRDGKSKDSRDRTMRGKDRDKKTKSRD